MPANVRDSLTRMNVARPESEVDQSQTPATTTLNALHVAYCLTKQAPIIDLTSVCAGIPCASGDILISDENNDRAIEVTHTTLSHIVATFAAAHGTVSGMAFASRLSNGNTLLTDSNNNRI